MARRRPPGFLVAALQRPVPAPGHLDAEGMHGVIVAGHGVIPLVPGYHAGQPFPLLRDGLVPASHDLVFDHLQLHRTADPAAG